jgi:hypothetical protein
MVKAFEEILASEGDTFEVLKDEGIEFHLVADSGEGVYVPADQSVERADAVMQEIFVEQTP